MAPKLSTASSQQLVLAVRLLALAMSQFSPPLLSESETRACLLMMKEAFAAGDADAFNIALKDRPYFGANTSIMEMYVHALLRSIPGHPEFSDDDAGMDKAMLAMAIRLTPAVDLSNYVQVNVQHLHVVVLRHCAGRTQSLVSMPPLAIFVETTLRLPDGHEPLIDAMLLHGADPLATYRCNALMCAWDDCNFRQPQNLLNLPIGTPRNGFVQVKMNHHVDHKELMHKLKVLLMIVCVLGVLLALPRVEGPVV